MLNKINTGFILKAAAILLIAFTIFWFGIEAKFKPEKTFLLSDRGEGEITMKAEYKSEQSKKETVIFKIYLNTHSEDLSLIDFKTSVYLEKDGQKYYPAANLDAGEGHHRESILTFSKIEEPFYLIGENIGTVKRREILFEL